MRNHFKNLFTILMLMTISISVSASVIYTFDVSDVSWASSSHGQTQNVQFWYEFNDNADLNALDNADLTGMGFVAEYGSASTSSISVLGNIDDFFGLIAGVASLTVGGSGNNAIWDSWGANSMQVGQGDNTSITAQTSEGFSRAHGRSVMHTYYAASSVPEPSAIALLGLGLVGLGFVRRRRQA